MIFRHLLNMRSHPTWVRGLKHESAVLYACHDESHPTWVRGLKHLANMCLNPLTSRTLRGCVD